MKKVIQIEVPDWVNDSIIKNLEKVINERLDEILVEAVWEAALEKSKVTEEEVMKIDEIIKSSAWRKLKKN